MDFPEYLIFTSLALLASYLGAYFSQNGKNKADLRTIRELTSKVEEVKASINVLLQNRLKYDSERYRVLVEFYEAFLVYFEYLRFIPLSTPGGRDSDIEVEKKIEKLQALFSSFIQAHSRLEIFFIDNPNVLNAAKLSYNICNQLEITVGNALYKIGEIDIELKFITLDQDGVKKAKEIHNKSMQLSEELSKDRQTDLIIFSESVKEIKKTISNEIKSVLFKENNFTT